MPTSGYSADCCFFYPSVGHRGLVSRYREKNDDDRRLDRRRFLDDLDCDRDQDGDRRRSVIDRRDARSRASRYGYPLTPFEGGVFSAARPPDG